MIVAQWESSTAVITDLASIRVLKEWNAELERLDLVNQASILTSLRLFLDDCPSCHVPLSYGKDVVELCCSTVDVFALTCEHCDSRVIESTMAGD